MKSKQAAIQEWASQFCSAYAATSVPHNAKFPFLTYSLPWGAFGDVANMTINVYSATPSEKEINQLGRRIEKNIGIGGVVVKCDGGAVWLTRGSPFCQAVKDEENVKRLTFNITVNHLTN